MLVAAESGLSSQRIFPSHAQNFFVFWKRPAERAIIPHVKLCEIGDANQLAHTTTLLPIVLHLQVIMNLL